MRWIILLLALCTPLAAKYQYAIPTRAQDRVDVAYIITTIANKSTPALLFHAGTLNAAGDRIKHLHPLQFLEIIFGSDELKVATKNIRRKSFVWNNHMMKGLRDRLDEAFRHGTLTPIQIDEFADAIRIDPAAIRSALNARQWDSFIETLLNSTPRQGNPNRYDM